MPTRERSVATSTLRVEDVLAVQHDLARRALAGIEAVDAVHGAQQRRLAAAGGADQRGHALLDHRQRDA